ncbi:MAG: DUF2203 domain-containing protein [Bryobacteraceae bacterium]|nr:DUF2203 domain-containing protein [Bryobacteraceae bacterium]
MKLFDVHSARSLLPEVRRLLAQGMDARSREVEVRRVMAAFAERAQLMGGARLDPEQAEQWRRELAVAAALMRQAVKALEGLGVLVKDLDIGLVDFPTLYRGQEVLLCWRYGEPDIAWWHGLEEGFRGRKPVDEDFLRNHRGG